MYILTYEQLPHGGFAGLEERRFVFDSRVLGGQKHTSATEGLGNFVYLADANFLPKGETGMHPHREIDVISVMVEGNIEHTGSLEHGQSLSTGMVQVQRAGAEGFTHNELNPEASANQMIQLWVLPDEPGEPAGYQVYTPQEGERLQIYGGSKEQVERFYSRTAIDVANLQTGQTTEHNGEVMAYLCKGSAKVNNQTIAARTLIKADGLIFRAESEVQLILVYCL